MQLYQTYKEIETLWMLVEDILTEETTTGPDGLEVTPDIALAWIDECLQKLEGERDKKALNIACAIKNIRAEAMALKVEKLRLEKRQRAAMATCDRLEQYLADFIPGIRLQDQRAKIGWRESYAVEVEVPPTELPADLCRVKVEPDLRLIKDAILSGRTVNGAKIVKHNNVQIS